MHSIDDPSPRFTHIDASGSVRMVDVSEKAETARIAIASGRIFMKPETLAMIRDQRMKKGNVLETARIAGILAAKKTSELIPMCHPLNIRHVQVDFEMDTESIRIEALVKVTDKTGVEMEALTAVAVSALTIYDMCKAVDRGMVIGQIGLLEKDGGASGLYRRSPDEWKR
ncbi:MAG: cyclic pyranopterin monophosphate synthase MoaC [Thermodesulfobacteriota bacterium]